MSDQEFAVTVFGGFITVLVISIFLSRMVRWVFALFGLRA